MKALKKDSQSTSLFKDPDKAWIQTFTGKRINVFDPWYGDIKIADIAHALSNICRFTGHCQQFYSVAEHSYYVSQYVPRSMAMKGLLHDASEAYLCDVPRPIKPHLTNYAGIEHMLTTEIFKRFGLNPGIPDEIKDYDGKLCVTEGYYMMNGIDGWELAKKFKPILNFDFQYWTPERAESMFLNRFIRLSNL